jgi:hypothetical protein
MSTIVEFFVAPDDDAVVAVADRGPDGVYEAASYGNFIPALAMDGWGPPSASPVMVPRAPSPAPYSLHRSAGERHSRTRPGAAGRGRGQLGRR